MNSHQAGTVIALLLLILAWIVWWIVLFYVLQIGEAVLKYLDAVMRLSQL